MKTTDQVLIKKGYRESSPLPFKEESVERTFYKAFSDEKGRKYSIIVNKWKGWRHPHTKEVNPPEYEYELQLYKNETHDAINLCFLSSWSIDEVEEFVEQLFATGLFGYYEEEK